MMIDGDYFVMGNKVLHAGNYTTWAAPKSHSSTDATYGGANTSTYGHVKLHSSDDCTEYTSNDGAATPAAVKKAFGLFNAVSATKATNDTNGQPIHTTYAKLASANTFTQVFPSLKDKITVIENILSPTFVRSRAMIENVDNMSTKEGEIRLLSVGRFCTAKNYDNLPFILKCIRDKGINAKWYIIGYGSDEPLIRQKIAETGMQEHVIILGKKANPYPYIKACDIYVQPSRYEGKSVTVREAQMLCKPVVVTNYPTASSQIKNGDDGVIVPLDNEGCAKGLAEFILDTEKQNHIIEYLKAHDYGNVEEVEKIYDIIKI
jgi:glycosyltransferase involved in cell wall biosynthesis